MADRAQIDSAPDVADVAGRALVAARSLDVDAGARLMCTTPTSQQVNDLQELISTAREWTGTDNPSVVYHIAHVSQSGEHGSFDVTVQVQDRLAGEEIKGNVSVTKVDGRWCTSAFDPA